jgi:hypothetical protein
MLEPDDWRLLNAKQHLEGATFRLKPYRTKNAEWDHDHCTGCWARFAGSNIPDAFQEGYAVTSDYKHGEDYVWICAECFAALKEQLGWRLVE